MIKSKNPLVTVYVTNYNYAKYISKAIDSLIKQTYDNIEILIFDDGSEDNSIQIIKKYSNIENIKCFFQKNIGLNKTNNKAISKSSGKYIMRLDADDWLDYNAIEIMANHLERNPDNFLVFPDYYIVDEDENLINVYRRHDFEKITLKDQPAHGACTMIRLSSLKKIGGYNEKFFCQDGVDIWTKIIDKEKINNINLPLFYYRQHGSNLTSNEDKIFSTKSQILKENFKNNNNNKALAIIPIRDHIENLNLNPLHEINSKKIIDWTIESVLRSDFIDKIVIVSNNKDLEKYINNKYSNKIDYVNRPVKLENFNIPLRETFFYILEKYKKNKFSYDYFFQFTIESPFRKHYHIDNSMLYIQKYNCDIVVPVKYENDIFYKHNGNSLVPVMKSNNKLLKLEREELYREVGGMRLYSTNYIYQNKLDPKIGHILVDDKSAFRIKTSFDLKNAEKF
jgi:glycosyltransferase involved in cell wall biosynthesis